MDSAAAPAPPASRGAHPWAMLAVAVYAQTSTTVVLATPAFLIPLLHSVQGMSLAQAGLLAAAPNLGMVLALVAWGAAADRWGERRVLVLGLLVTVLAVLVAMLVHGYVALGIALIVAGIGAASTNAASGRVVVGWFPRERRGLAMGIRQACQPLGTAIAALAVPPLVAAGSVLPALILGAVMVFIACAACAVVIVDPPRPERVRVEGVSDNPYRHGMLWRIHAVSVLLVVPQFALSTFGLVWMVAGLGFSTLVAGIVVSGAQFLGAAGRVAVGVLSDRVGSRLRPLRWVAIAGIVALLATAGAGMLGEGALGWAIAAAGCYVIASCISVADNGLAFTSVAEIAGPFWSGRALGAQNTGQFVGAALVGPVVGALIGIAGYAGAFALVALAPLVAVPLVPSARHERERTPA
jgi:MFS family permease